MQEHLKERLTGAGILVVLVVLLVPEMFRGRPVLPAQRDEGANDALPLRSYTIDLRDTAAARPPAESVAAGSAPAPAVTLAPAAAPAPTVTPTAAPAAAPRAATVPVPAPSAAPAAGWVVQVGSFARRDFAERLVTQVRAKGFVVEVAGPDGRGLYRVRSAPLSGPAAAAALRQKMQAHGLKPIVNRAP